MSTSVPLRVARSGRKNSEVRELDKYDEAIEWLLDQDDVGHAIYEAWDTPHMSEGGILFQFATPSGEQSIAPWQPVQCGCLTQVRSQDRFVAWTPELTKTIQNDLRIPVDETGITEENLEVFAEWQRRLDREIRGDQK